MLKKITKLFRKKSQLQNKSADVVRKRLAELKIDLTYPDIKQDKMNIEDFQQALINFICDHLDLKSDKVSFTIHKHGDQAICNMTVAIPDENMA